MDRVKRYYVGDAGLVEGEALGRLSVVLAADFDRVQAENKALQELLNQRDEANHDLEQRRHAEQQACQAAERRAEELEAQLQHKDKGIEFRDALIGAVRMSSKELLAAWVPSDWEAKRSALFTTALNPITEAASHDE
ncbi:UNVERIFIED_ORG: hypothetical protein J2Y77_005818 [Pseudomonas lini]